MSSLWRELLVIGAALLLVAAAVEGLGDRHVMQAPPESVVEEFTSKVAEGRYRPAASYLGEALRDRVTDDSLRRLREGWRAETGGIGDVEGEAGPERGDTAWPSARVRADDGTIFSVRVPVVYQRGGWRVVAIGPLVRGD